MPAFSLLLIDFVFLWVAWHLDVGKMERDLIVAALERELATTPVESDLRIGGSS